MQTQNSEFHDQLIRGLAHKMNNCLSLFHGYLSVLMEGKDLDRETIEGLTGIRDGARAASELLDRAKSLASPSSLIWREIDLGAFMATLKPVLENMPTESSVSVEYPEDLPRVLADPGRLRTAIKELVTNACEAVTKNGSVTVRVLGATDLPEPTKAMQSLRWVSIDVHDDGPGIPWDLRAKIFQPFFTTGQRQNSSGLGLTVARELIQQMGGVLRFESAPGDTTFHLLLPAKTQKF